MWHNIEVEFAMVRMKILQGSTSDSLHSLIVLVTHTEAMLSNLPWCFDHLLPFARGFYMESSANFLEFHGL